MYIIEKKPTPTLEKDILCRWVFQNIYETDKKKKIENNDLWITQSVISGWDGTHITDIRHNRWRLSNS